ncbi:hypothetical protein ARMGADRAFT_749946 [Armillaria gallica]|uniref:Uncharacterized protein n=1 Tax=Armillaria gallica TaxID=47427 RepID=A0A2H3DWK0_ARMGA|nr:hypothetical protein ARMGADRAFT_749946 [Armillaria gallica]
MSISLVATEPCGHLNPHARTSALRTLLVTLRSPNKGGAFQMLGNSQIHLHVLDCSAALCRWSTPASIHFSSPPAYTRDSMFSAALLPSSLATAQSHVRHAQTRAPGGHAPSLANRKHKQSTFSIPTFSYHHPQSTTNDPSCRTPPVLVWF